MAPSTVTNPTVSEIEQGSTASQDDDDDDSELTFTPPRKSRLSAPQLQAQLSQLCDRTRLRRLKDTLHSKGAWRQVTRIDDLCHSHVSHKWLFHLAACAGSVLTPHDYITNVQTRLGNRASTAFGQCCSCGSFMDTQLEHGEPCSTAEATREHYACVHAVFGGLKLADRCHHRTWRTHRNTIQTDRSLHYRCCLGTQRGSGCVCGVLHCSSSPRRRRASSI